MAKTVQNNCIFLTSTIPQYSQACHTLGAAAVASQQLLQAPSSSRPQRALARAPLFPPLALPNPPRAATAVCGYARAIAPTPQTNQLLAPLPPSPPCAPPTLGGIISPICRTSGRERLRVSRSMTYL